MPLNLQDVGQQTDISRLRQKITELEQNKTDLDAALQMAQAESQGVRDEALEKSEKEKVELESRLNELSELLVKLLFYLIAQSRTVFLLS